MAVGREVDDVAFLPANVHATRARESHELIDEGVHESIVGTLELDDGEAIDAPRLVEAQIAGACP